MEFLALVVIFWLPPVMIFFKNALWNLHLWQQKQYRFERFLSYIRWDHLPNNRDLLLYNLKYFVFSLVCTLVISIYSSSLGVLFAYTIWSLEIFLLLEKVFSGKSETIKVSVRSLTILLLLAAGVVTLIITLTLPFADLQRESGMGQPHILPNFIKPSSEYAIQDIYVYLSLSTIFALFIDLASPIITAVIVLLTSPIGWIKAKLSILRLKDKISRYRNNLTIVAVTGSIGKTVTKELLIKILKDEYSILKTADIYTTIEELSNDITEKLSETTQVLLVEIEPFKKGEIAQISKILEPDISIITDIDVQHYGAFRNKKDYIDARLELIEGTNPNGAVIATIDNKYILHYLNSFKGQKIGFSFLNKKSNQLNELNNVEIYKRSIDGYKFMLKSKNGIAEYSTPIHRTSLLHQLVPAILAAKKLGLTEKTIKEKVSKINDKFTNIYSLEGDDHSLLISSGNPDSNLKGVLAAVDYANNIKKKFNHPRIILISDGVSELGKIKRKSYAKLIEKLKHKVSIVVTTDPLLYDLIAHSYLDILTIKAKNTSDTIFTTRTLLKSGDIIIVEGKDSEEILASLRSQE